MAESNKEEKNNENENNIQSKEIDDNKKEEINSNKEETKEEVKEEVKEEINQNKEETKEKKEEVKEKKGKNFKPEDYILMLSIGTGNFSEVHLVEHKTTKILYALKTFEKRRVESLHKERDVLMEKYALEKMTPHKNIIGYYGTSKDDFEMFILYEYINGGDLWHKKVI